LIKGKTSSTQDSQEDRDRLEKLITGLFETTKESLENGITGELQGRYVESQVLEVPLLQNIYGETAIDIIMGITPNINRNAKGFFVELPQKYKRKEEDCLS